MLIMTQSMNFASGIPVLFGFVMYTGGPTAAFANWTMVGGLSFIVSLSMAEIAAALPTAGGIYYCKCWRRNPFPILNSLMISSLDTAPTLPKQS
jgi:amino acid permease